MPRAVATGSAGNASPDDHVSPLRVGIVSGVLAAAAAYAYFGVHAVWPLHDPLLVDAARERLAAAEIPNHIQSTRLRSLLWIAGSYVPMMVMVPPQHAEAAHALPSAWLSSPSDNG